MEEGGLKHISKYTIQKRILQFQNRSQCEWVIKRAGTFKPNKTVMVGEDMGRYFAINHKGNE